MILFGRDSRGRSVNVGSLVEEEIKAIRFQFLIWVQEGVPEGTRSTRTSAGAETGRTMTHGSAVRSAEFSPDGTRVVTAALDARARLWTAATGHPVTPPLQIRFFKTTWTNGMPGVEILSLDYVSKLTESAPFLLAIMAE